MTNINERQIRQAARDFRSTLQQVDALLLAAERLTVTAATTAFGTSGVAASDRELDAMVQAEPGPRQEYLRRLVAEGRATRNRLGRHLLTQPDVHRKAVATLVAEIDDILVGLADALKDRSQDRTQRTAAVRTALLACMRVLQPLQRTVDPTVYHFLKARIHHRLSELYMQTASDLSWRSPYFDSDLDGCTDANDRFPLNPTFCADRDFDHVPDPFDDFPDDMMQWRRIEPGVERSARYHGMEVRQDLAGDLHYAIRVYLDPIGSMDGVVQATFEAKSAMAVNRYFRGQLARRGIQFDFSYVASPALATATVYLQAGLVRESAARWSLASKAETIIHEVAHLAGADDYYHEPMTIRDQTFTPGVELLTIGHLMSCSGGAIRPEDLLLPGALALAAAQY